MKANGLNRRKFFEKSVKGGIGAIILSSIPFKSFGKSSPTPVKRNIKLKIHPSAIKRNK